ncbi:MAG: hypothetical protein J6L64_07480 [Opitutales bacterium]|nr:hypothetical protein [Opitutales bacterium]
MPNYYFFRRGGAEQLRIETPEDLSAIVELDPKLWVALSMPVRGQEFDARTLALLDSDSDGRIRVPEILAAVKFVRENFSNFDAFFAGRDAFPLSSLSEKSSLRETAAGILARLGKPDAGTLALEDVEAAGKAFDAQAFNGDGVLVPGCAEGEPATEKFLADAIVATGGSADASGAQGVSAAQIADFVKSAEAVLAWRADAEKASEKIFPLGEKTADAFAALSKIRAKTEDFFARTRLASFDPAAESKMNPGDADFAALAAGGEISAAASERFPLARVAATDGEPVLPLACGINPAWVPAIADFVEKALVPACEKLGVPVAEKPSVLPASLWGKTVSLFAPYAAWLAAKPAGGADAFPSERLQEILAGNFVEKTVPLFEKDAAEKPLRDALSDTEKLCRYSRDLAVILRNFVSFAEFYKRDADSTAFLVGKLYMDGRTCSMCVRVDSAAVHSALAAKSNCCLAYCDCTRKNGGEKMSIVAMFGDGDALSLYVGRNGVFYDKKGNDWDAKIVKIIENPISIRQAFWSPYRKVAKFVETQIENFAAAREKKVDGDLSAGAGTALTKATTAPTGTPGAAAPAAKPAFDVAKFAGIFAAIGLALGAIGAALSVAVSGFLALAPWQMGAVVLAVILMISAPSMLIAAMKLRRRSLGPILEANGWAINGNVKINIPLGKAFTEMPKKPRGARVSRADPFRKKSFPWGKICIVFVLVAAIAAIAWRWFGACVNVG